MSDQVLDQISTTTVTKMEMVSRLIKSKNEYRKHISDLKKTILILKRAIKKRVSCVKNFSRVEAHLCHLNYYLKKFKGNKIFTV